MATIISRADSSSSVPASERGGPLRHSSHNLWVVLRQALDPSPVKLLFHLLNLETTPFGSPAQRESFRLVETAGHGDAEIRAGSEKRPDRIGEHRLFARVETDLGQGSHFVLKIPGQRIRSHPVFRTGVFLEVYRLRRASVEGVSGSTAMLMCR
jgi:hypothetical protein